MKRAKEERDNLQEEVQNKFKKYQDRRIKAAQYKLKQGKEEEKKRE